MERFELLDTPGKPRIILDKVKGTFLIEGRSIPNDPVKIYQPVLQWLSCYAQSPNNCTTFDFKLDYFNSSSQKSILNIFKILGQLHKSGSNVHIRWFYNKEDEEMLKIGHVFSDLVDVQFQYIPYDQRTSMPA